MAPSPCTPKCITCQASWSQTCHLLWVGTVLMLPTRPHQDFVGLQKHSRGCRPRLLQPGPRPRALCLQLYHYLALLFSQGYGFPLFASASKGAPSAALLTIMEPAPLMTTRFAGFVDFLGFLLLGVLPGVLEGYESLYPSSSVLRALRHQP